VNYDLPNIILPTHSFSWTTEFYVNYCTVFLWTSVLCEMQNSIFLWTDFIRSIHHVFKSWFIRYRINYFLLPDLFGTSCWIGYVSCLYQMTFTRFVYSYYPPTIAVRDIVIAAVCLSIRPSHFLVYVITWVNMDGFEYFFACGL